VSETDGALRDVSVGVRVGTPEWPGDTPYACGWTSRIADGASVSLTAFTMSPHVGTHADAPLHVRDGGDGADALPLGAFVGPCVVLDVAGLPDADVELDALVAAARGAGVTLEGAARVLLRTGRSIAAGAFPAAWPALSPACARALVRGGLRLLGVDAPSVDRRESKSLDVHHALFDGGACNLENLDLRGVPPGPYELLAAPIKLVALDAAPVRALLRPVAG
jgi:arylformamidase